MILADIIINVYFIQWIISFGANWSIKSLRIMQFQTELVKAEIHENEQKYSENVIKNCHIFTNFDVMVYEN